MPAPREEAPAHTALPGIIIAASVIVAAGIAIYESEQIRVWIDENRRRIAIALHTLGDGIQPAPQTEAELRGMQDANRRRRMDIVRRNRLELIRRAREEGVAVDLDALAALGHDDAETRSPAASAPSFDDMVGQDGKLRPAKAPEMEQRSASGSSFAPASDRGLRRRAAGAAAFASGASFGTAFDEDMRMDVDVIGPSAGFPRSVPINVGDGPQESGTVNSGVPAVPDHLDDLPPWAAGGSHSENEGQSRYKTDDELEAEIQEAIRRSLADVPASALQQPEEGLLVNTSAQVDPFSDAHALHSSLHSSPWTQDLQGLDNSLYALPSPRIEPQSIPILSVDSVSDNETTEGTNAQGQSAATKQDILDYDRELNRLAQQWKEQSLQERGDSAMQPNVNSQGQSAAAKHALQDYQMQLMMLEQQNKKRLLQARRDLETIAESTAPAAWLPSATADNKAETTGHDGGEMAEGIRTPTSATASAGDSDNDIDEVISIMSGEAVADDARSDAEMSEFSVVGVSTPGSWTDVDTEGEDEA